MTADIIKPLFWGFIILIGLGTTINFLTEMEAQQESFREQTYEEIDEAYEPYEPYEEARAEVLEEETEEKSLLKQIEESKEEVAKEKEYNAAAEVAIEADCNTSKYDSNVCGKTTDEERKASSSNSYNSYESDSSSYESKYDSDSYNSPFDNQDEVDYILENIDETEDPCIQNPDLSICQPFDGELSDEEVEEFLDLLGE